MSKFYDNLIDLCDKNNIGITALCNETKVSIGNTASWKKGNVPGAKILQKIADYFNVSTDYLLGKTDDPNIKNHPSPFESDGWKQIRTLFESSDEETKKAMFDYAHYLLQKEKNGRDNKK